MQPSAFLLRLFIIGGIVTCSLSTAAQNTVNYINEGNNNLRKEKYEAAISAFSTAIRFDPKSYTAYYGRANAYFKIPRYNESVADYSQAIKLLPVDSSRLASRFYTERGSVLKAKSAKDSAFLDFEEAFRLDSSNLQACQFLAEYFYNKSIYELALRYNSKLIALVPGNAEFYRMRGKINYGLNNLDDAIADITTAMKLDGKYSNYGLRGVFYTRLGKYNEAINDLLLSIKNDTYNGNSYINIVSPLARLKRFREASVFYNLYSDKLNLLVNNTNGATTFRAYTDVSKTYKFYNYYIKAVDLVADNHTTEAMRQLDTASLQYGTDQKVETKRCYVDVLALRGYLLEQTGHYDEAMDTYHQALILDPNQPDVEEALLNTVNEIASLRQTTRAIDKTVPSILAPHLDTVRYNAVSNLPDSIAFSVSATVQDPSGIRSVTVDNIPVTKLEEDGFFRYKFKRSKNNTSPIIISAVDSANNIANYSFDTLSNSRGGKLVSTMPASAAKFGRNHAILIAEKDYTDPGFKSLKYPVKDANSLRQVLLQRYTFEPEDIDTLYNRSREDILETVMARCKSLGPDDNLLVFYAGHGDTTMDKFNNVDGYLIPTSAQKGKISYFITSEEIKKALKNSNARHILFLLDACYSGAFTRGDEVTDIQTTDMEKQWESPSRKVMTSGNIEAVPDNSFFIYYLTEFLRNNKKQYLSTKDLWNYVDNGIREHKKNPDGQQYYSPQYSAITGVGDKGGTYIFVLRKTD